jgi:hypothetical protein
MRLRCAPSEHAQLRAHLVRPVKLRFGDTDCPSVFLRIGSSLLVSARVAEVLVPEGDERVRRGSEFDLPALLIVQRLGKRLGELVSAADIAVTFLSWICGLRQIRRDEFPDWTEQARG